MISLSKIPQLASQQRSVLFVSYLSKNGSGKRQCDGGDSRGYAVHAAAPF